MLNKFKSALYSAVGGVEDGTSPSLRELADPRLPKFPYSRPQFLRLASEDEAQVAGDRSIRAIMVPRDITWMPWMSGYAEAVNAGKSKRNEDNAHIHVGTLHQPGGGAAGDAAAPGRSVRYYYFGVFDGHAGHGASTAAANQLHHIVHEKLVDVIDHLLPGAGPTETPDSPPRSAFLWVPPEELSVDKLVTGALEAAFNEMDALIAEDRRKYEMRGGCTALVALFLLGRLYVANAGDSRAVVCRRDRALVASHDFTPETERQRVRQLACRQPALCGGEFTHLEFCRRVTRRDLGKRLLYRDAHMTGWAYKTVTEDDVKFPVVCGEGKRSRVCATIGVTRGFGDHGLRAQNTGVYVKPFLLSQPEVLVINLEEDQVTSSDVLVMATDGLWDVTPNDRVAQLVERALNHFPAEDESMRRYRCISAAQELVMAARGKLRESRQWRMPDGSPATVDDISVFVIPLLAYQEEHLLWKMDNGVPVPPAAPQMNGVPESPPGADSTPTVNGDTDRELAADLAEPPAPALSGDLDRELAADLAEPPAPALSGELDRSQDRMGSDRADAPTPAPAPAAVQGVLETTDHRPVCGQTGALSGTGRTNAAAPPSCSQPAPSASSPVQPDPSASQTATPEGQAMPSISNQTRPVIPSLAVPAPPNSTVPASSSSAVSTPYSVTVPAPSSQAVPAPSSVAVSVPSSSAVPAPSSATVLAPSSAAVPAPLSTAVPAPPSATVPAPISTAVPAPTSAAVPAPSSATVLAPSSAAVPAPSSAAVPAPLSTAVPAPPSAAVPAPSSAAVPAPSSAAVPAPLSTAVPAPLSTAVPAPPSATVPAPLTTAVPAPSSAAVSAPLSTAVPAPTSAVVPAPTSAAVSAPSSAAVPAPLSTVVPAPSSAAVPALTSAAVPAPSSAAVPAPSSAAAAPAPVSDLPVPPLVVGQTVPPTLVQTVPRSSVQLLPPADGPAPASPPTKPPPGPATGPR